MSSQPNNDLLNDLLTKPAVPQSWWAQHMSFGRHKRRLQQSVKQAAARKHQTANGLYAMFIVVVCGVLMVLYRENRLASLGFLAIAWLAALTVVGAGRVWGAAKAAPNVLGIWLISAVIAISYSLGLSDIRLPLVIIGALAVIVLMPRGGWTRLWLRYHRGSALRTHGLEIVALLAALVVTTFVVRAGFVSLWLALIVWVVIGWWMVDRYLRHAAPGANSPSPLSRVTPVMNAIQNNPQVQNLRNRNWVIGSLTPVAPEPLSYRIWRAVLLVLGTLGIMIMARLSREYWPGWILVVICLIWWALAVLERWHVYAHIETFLPDQGWIRRGVQLANGVVAILVAFIVTSIAWHISWEKVVSALMVDWILLMWVAGPHPSPIHGYMKGEQLVEFFLPVARRKALPEAIGLVLGALVEFVLICLGLWLGFWLESWFVVVAVLIVGGFGMKNSRVWYTNRFPGTKQLWTKIPLRLVPRLIEVDTKASENDITGGIITIPMDKLGQVTIVDQPKTITEIMYGILGIVEVDFSVIGGPDQPVFLLSRGIWMFKDDMDDGSGKVASRSKVLKGKEAWARWFVWAADETKLGRVKSEENRKLRARDILKAEQLEKAQALSQS